MSVINSQPLIGASGNQGVATYDLTRSLRFRSSASANLNRTPASAGNRQKWTWSAWVKRGTLSSGQTLFGGHDGIAGQQGSIDFKSDNTLQIYTGGDSGSRGDAYTTAVFRDPSAWYHIVGVLDTTQATGSNRIKIYVNGVQQTVTFTATPTQNYNGQINAAVNHRIGTLASLSQYFDGYIAELNFVDGQALTPADFGETSATTGVWIPKAYTGTYGTNGFYLDFEDTSSVAALGYDAAGSNDWTVNNVSLTSGTTYDSMTDVPTLTSATAANYAVGNPLSVGAGGTWSDGNLKVVKSGASAITNAFSTIGINTNAFYWETTWSAGANFYAGIATQSATLTALTTGTIIYNQAGEIQLNGSVVSTHTSLSVNDVLGVAVDFTNSKIYFYKNNTLVNSGGYSFTVGSNTWFALFGTFAANDAQIVNFGQRPFAYTPPTGFVALNTFNLP
jgi:hypothetical protein